MTVDTREFAARMLERLMQAMPYSSAQEKIRKTFEEEGVHEEYTNPEKRTWLNDYVRNELRNLSAHKSWLKQIGLPMIEYKIKYLKLTHELDTTTHVPTFKRDGTKYDFGNRMPKGGKAYEITTRGARDHYLTGRFRVGESHLVIEDTENIPECVHRYLEDTQMALYKYDRWRLQKDLKETKIEMNELNKLNAKLERITDEEVNIYYSRYVKEHWRRQNDSL